MKKLITIALASTLLVSTLMLAPAHAAPSKDLRIIPVIVNGHKVKFPDTEPYINTDERVMVPVGLVSEKLGGKVKWDAAAKIVHIQFKTKEVIMPVGSKEATVDGEVVTLDTSAELTEGRVMVPLRFVSEVLDSEVKWDSGAHAVQVTDTAYQAKVDAGTVKLDPWGREFSKTYDPNWMKLSDLPDIFYKYTEIGKFYNRKYYTMAREWDFKTYVDQWAEHIRQYYAVQLNVDYRTINEKTFMDTLISHMTFQSSFDESNERASMKRYVAWVKKNKVIVRGYADPENSQVSTNGDGSPFVRTRFKFKVLSATDTSQTFLDNYDVGRSSDSYKLKKNVWYDGYSEVMLGTTYSNMQWKHYAIKYNENMFMKSVHVYEEIQ